MYRNNMFGSAECIHLHYALLLPNKGDKMSIQKLLAKDNNAPVIILQIEHLQVNFNSKEVPVKKDSLERSVFWFTVLSKIQLSLHALSIIIDFFV